MPSASGTAPTEAMVSPGTEPVCPRGVAASAHGAEGLVHIVPQRAPGTIACLDRDVFDRLGRDEYTSAWVPGSPPRSSNGAAPFVAAAGIIVLALVVYALIVWRNTSDVTYDADSTMEGASGRSGPAVASTPLPTPTPSPGSTPASSSTPTPKPKPNPVTLRPLVTSVEGKSCRHLWDLPKGSILRLRAPQRPRVLSGRQDLVAAGDNGPNHSLG